MLLLRSCREKIPLTETRKKVLCKVLDTDPFSRVSVVNKYKDKGGKHSDICILHLSFT